MYLVDLIPILDNNYVFSIRAGVGLPVVIVDPGSFDEVASYLDRNDFKLGAIILTHHHDDHIAGIEELKRYHQKQNLSELRIYGPAHNQLQIPTITHKLSDGDQIAESGIAFKIKGLPGHTIGHIAYLNEDENLIFSGDVLFGLGCGRFYEGTWEQGFHSINWFKHLSPITKVYCTHEYGIYNLAFCRSLQEQQLLPKKLNIEELIAYSQKITIEKEEGIPSVPLLLGDEFKCNPFLNTESLEEFITIRSLRNTFKRV